MNSGVLKENSTYFLKFLDPVNVAAPGANSVRAQRHEAGFQYNWVSEIDDDGDDWKVICASACVVCSSLMPAQSESANHPRALKPQIPVT